MTGKLKLGCERLDMLAALWGVGRRSWFKTKGVKTAPGLFRWLTSSSAGRGSEGERSEHFIVWRAELLVFRLRI